MRTKLVVRLALLFLVAEVLLVFVSWLLSATMNDSVRPMLSGEGIRWLFGHFVDIVMSPLLAWIILLGMAYGCLVKSRLLRAFVHREHYRERFALRVALALLIVYAAVVAWLIAVPQAMLLSATGALWPSPFSRALVPLLSLGILLLSVSYGGLSRTFDSLSDVVNSIVWGITQTAPLLFLYVLAVQFVESLRFVFA